MIRAGQNEALWNIRTSQESDACCPGALDKGDRTGRHQWRMRLTWCRAALALSIVGTAFAIGCAPATRPDFVKTALRFIDEDPEELFTGKDLFREEHVFTWTFDTREDLSWWRLALLEKEFPPTADHATLRATRRFPRLFRRAQIETDSIHALRLVAEGLRYEVVLYWSNSGQRHSRERRLIVMPQDPPGARVKTYDFYVASHPLWTGRTKELRLDPTALPEQEFQFHALTGVKFIVVPERLKAAVERAWKVELRREVRNARVVPPGQRVERELLIPEDAELQFAYGFLRGIITPHTAGAISFSVSVRRGGGEASRLFEGKIDPTLKGSALPGWNEETIDLKPYAGERVQLILETAPNESWQAIHGFPIWASPEVVHRIRRTPYDPEAAGKPGTPKAAPANVILVSMDSLRADHLSLYGYERQTSPNIDDWARRVGVTFENAIAQAPSTLPSHVSMLTGLDAPSHHVSSGPVPSSLTTLAELLRRAGYATVAVTGGGPLGSEGGLFQGFDRYGYWVGQNDFYELIYGINRVMEWLEANADRPFFLFFHTFEVSDPFRARAPYASEFGADLQDAVEEFVRVEPAEPKTAGLEQAQQQLIWPDGSSYNEGSLSSEQRASVVNMYDSGIAYADNAFGQLLTRLRELKLEHDTLIILTSGHGEALGEHGRIGHGYLSDEDFRVPLVFAFPRRLVAARVISARARSVDILPTVVDLLDLPSLSGIDGVSLVPLMESDS